MLLFVLSLLYPVEPTFHQRQGSVDNPAISELTGAADDLKRIIAAQRGTPVADKLEDALAKFESAMGKLRGAPADLQGGLGDLEGAAGDIEAAVTSGLLRARAATAPMGRITRAARQIAVRAVADAVARRADSTKIGEARRVLGVGDAERNASRYKNAVAHYRDAVAKAQGA
jgi:hypothetical protein